MWKGVFMKLEELQVYSLSMDIAERIGNLNNSG